MHENDPADVELLVHSLQVKIRIFQENYKNIVTDMNVLCAICIECAEQKIDLSSHAKNKLYETTEMLLKHYPENKKMPYENFSYLTDVDPSLEVLSETYAHAFKNGKLRIAR